MNESAPRNAIRTLQDDSDFLVSSLGDIRRISNPPAAVDSSTDLVAVLTEIRNAKEYNLDQVTHHGHMFSML